jgi:hypothetical protein
MAKDVYLVCPKCERFVGYDSEEQAKTTASSHNKSRHDGTEMTVIITPSMDGVRKLMKKAQETLSDDQLTQFQNYLRNQPKVMDRYFTWNGNFDEWHDDFDDYKKLKRIILLKEDEE